MGNEGQQSIGARFSDGTPAVAERYAQLVLWLRCERAYPPGKPLDLILAVDEGEATVSGRCIGSRRQAEGSYQVRMRLTNLTRQLRQALEARLPVGS